MSIGWIETATGAFRYELDGAGDGPVLVLLHEMGGSLHSFDAVMPALRATRRVLRFDARGFGFSVKLTGPLAMADWVGDLDALLDALGISGPCDIAGSALNGATALAFAAAHPDRVRKVLAMSPVTEVREDRRAWIADFADRMQADGMAPLTDNNDTSYPPQTRTDGAAFAAFRARWLCNDPRSFAETYRMLSALDMTADFARITCPVMLIGAVHDVLRPPELVRALVDKLPDAQYREVASGHFLPIQTPELFVDLVAECLAP